MARDATARLYDVDEDSLVYKRLRLTDKYDQATITFRAREGTQIDLAKLHESVWATRLSGGTRSGVICLEATAQGEAVLDGTQTIFKVEGSDQYFLLVDDVEAKPAESKPSALKDVREAMARGESIVAVTGYVDGWVGRWPTVLSKPPAKNPRLMVTSFQVSGAR